ncbi:unnamed protein product [Medioppia subpectinata]|uniref:Uncharacterized protein n=1 Tax=Medioppia subpectinata TaxID=1979941 RepID=A0A7R9KC15_9ACAR|nr:unnamed protein product [Medioppia subpectinata]CAG2100322.1 unnamed protein product [Medioppia subpectinata]
MNVPDIFAPEQPRGLIVGREHRVVEHRVIAQVVHFWRIKAEITAQQFPDTVNGVVHNRADLIQCRTHLSVGDKVDDLCNNPVLDHAVLSPDNKTAWLFRGKDIWHLHNLPTNPKASPSKCNVTKHSSDVTKIWQKFDTKGDALFLLESPGQLSLATILSTRNKNRHDLVLLHRHKYTIWDFNGGAPKVEGFIKEQPITAYGNNKGTKKQMFTEKPIVAPVEDDKRDEKSIVYQEEPFRKLCMDPTIDSADSSLDGTEIYLFKGDNYYLLTGLKGKGIGKLTKFERSDKLLPNFKPKSAAVMTCKEGQTRGYAYEYFSKTAGKKTTTMSKSWEIDKNVDKPEDEFIEYTAAGFTAAFHNRNVTDPQMIVLRNDDIISCQPLYKWAFAAVLKHYESAEKLPPGVTAAFSMPDQMLYLFQGNHYCYRELFYNKKPLFCPEWRDSRDLFGCFGPDVKRGKTPSQGNKHDKKALADLCSDLNIGDLDRSWQREDTVYVWRGKKFWKIADFPRAPRVVQSWQREDTVYVWRGKKFWKIADFPRAPRVVQSGNTNTEWDGFSDDPDAVAIIQEGKMRRGWMLSFYGGYWSGWYPDQRPWISYKAWWGQPTGTMKFGATMHNGDIKNPMVLGFDGSQVNN